MLLLIFYFFVDAEETEFMSIMSNTIFNETKSHCAKNLTIHYHNVPISIFKPKEMETFKRTYIKTLKIKRKKVLKRVEFFLYS